MKSFLSIGNKVDELSYFKALIGDLKQKCAETPYSEKRAFALCDMQDIHLESELQLAMEEVSSKEKDFSELLQMTEFIFEQHDELQARVLELTAVN